MSKEKDAAGAAELRAQEAMHAAWDAVIEAKGDYWGAALDALRKARDAYRDACAAHDKTRKAPEVES